MIRYQEYEIKEEDGTVILYSSALKRRSKHTTRRRNFWTGCNRLLIRVLALHTYRQFVGDMLDNFYIKVVCRTKAAFGDAKKKRRILLCIYTV